LSGYFRMCAKKYPKNYMHLLAKLMPLQIAGHGVVSSPTNINIISVPHGHFLSEADIAQSRGEPAQIEHYEPPIEHAPQPEQSPRYKELEAKLLAMSQEDLLALAKAVGVER
jgi:hypothetical protein